MTPEDKNRATAAAILPLVGGAANISTIAHCMTRLRLGLHDRSLADDDALKALPAVLGVVDDDTYQIALGPGTVARVTPELQQLVDQDRASAAPAAHTPASEELASRGEAIDTASPSSRISPLLRPTLDPKIVSRISVRPEPSRPAMPRISPWCTSKLTPWSTVCQPLRVDTSKDRSRTERMTRPPPRRDSRTAPRLSLPTIAVMILSCVSAVMGSVRT